MLLVPRCPRHTKAQKYNQKPPPFFHRALSSLLFQKSHPEGEKLWGRGDIPQRKKKVFHSPHIKERGRGGREEDAVEKEGKEEEEKERTAERKKEGGV